jgi:hypothetical protein
MSRTPNENIAILEAYWTWANSVTMEEIFSTFHGPQLTAAKKHEADEAMTELVRDASSNTAVRETFAKAKIFVRALWSELSAPLSTTRLIMLKGIARAANGGFFKPVDPLGIMTWIGDANLPEIALGGATIIGTFAGDDHAEVLVALLDLLKSCAFPDLWVDQFTADGAKAIRVLRERIPRVMWGSNGAAQLRFTTLLQQGTTDLESRLKAAQALRAQKRIGSLKLGDGDIAGVVPPVPKPWYKHGEVIAPAFGGLVLGAFASRTHSETR